MSEIYYDLTEFGIKKLVNASCIEAYDLSNTQPDKKKESYIVGMMIEGKDMRVDFKTEANFQHRISALSIVII